MLAAGKSAVAAGGGGILLPVIHCCWLLERLLVLAAGRSVIAAGDLRLLGEGVFYWLVYCFWLHGIYFNAFLVFINKFHTN